MPPLAVRPTHRLGPFSSPEDCPVNGAYLPAMRPTATTNAAIHIAISDVAGNRRICDPRHIGVGNAGIELYSVGRAF